MVSLPVRLPPLVEQRRIVTKVEALLAAVDSARERLARVPAILKRYRQAVLAAACSGRLTEDWRQAHSDPTGSADLLREVIARRRERYARAGRAVRVGVPGGYEEPESPSLTDLVEVPAEWCWTTLSTLAALVGGLTKGQKRGGMKSRLRSVPYLRVANVQRGYLDLHEVKMIDATEEEISELRLLPGDVLFTEGGDRDKLGRGWVWLGEVEECIHQNHIFRARLYHEGVQSRFVSWYANSLAQQYFEEAGKQTVNLASINMTKLRALPIPLPGAKEQVEIVRRVNSLLTLADGIERMVRTAATRVHGLPQSILAKAFRGELVPTEAELAREEGRDYEPASVLLERIGNRRAVPVRARNSKGQVRGRGRG
jgi:type I restriction enzyme, S subunit